MGKRWSDPDFISELTQANNGQALIKFWRSPVFRERFYNIPAFLLPRLAEMVVELADVHLGRRIYYERSHASSCWLPSLWTLIRLPSR